MKIFVDEVAAPFETFPPIVTNNQQAQVPDVNDFVYEENVRISLQPQIHGRLSSTSISYEHLACQARWTRYILEACTQIFT